MGECEDLSEFNRGQNVTAPRLGQRNSKNLPRIEQCVNWHQTRGQPRLNEACGDIT